MIDLEIKIQNKMLTKLLQHTLLTETWVCSNYTVITIHFFHSSVKRKPLPARQPPGFL